MQILAMEHASALLQLISDAVAGAPSSNLSESDLMDRLESVRKQLQHSGDPAIPPEAAAVAVCHVTTQALALLVVQPPVAAKVASSKWQKRVFLLETAVASAVTILGRSGDEDSELHTADRRGLCGTYKRLLQTLWEASQSLEHACNTAAIVVRMGVVLAICWLSYDRVGTSVKAEKLLNVCSDFCLSHESTKQLAKWPLVLRGMVLVAEKKEHERALQCFRVVAEKCGAVEDDGVFFYWYAVVLIQSGRKADAIAALDKCVHANYEPVASLSLQALVSLQARDYHAAAEQLQRTLEIDFSHSRSLYNNALLMERMKNFEAQGQLLEYVLESRGNSDINPSTRKKHKQPGDVADLSSTVKSPSSLFDKASLAPLLPSQVTEVNTSMVHFHLAEAAMENRMWMDSKKHFEKFLHVDRRELCKRPVMVIEAARDYVYVLLQCKLPSLALRKCNHYLLGHEGSNATDDNVAAAVLLLHLYKADALLCLEHVEECYEYLTLTVQPKIQDLMRRPSSPKGTNTITEEIAACHVELLNNSAVATACCTGTEAAISILREGLQQYPNCLPVKFNLVLLLWRKGDQTTACSLWAQARGWSLQANTNGFEPKSMTSKTVASASQTISEHVQGFIDGEGGISAQQLAYLDALVLHSWRKTQNSQLVDKSLQYVEYLESLGTTNIPRHS